MPNDDSRRVEVFSKWDQLLGIDLVVEEPGRYPAVPCFGRDGAGHDGKVVVRRHRLNIETESALLGIRHGSAASVCIVSGPSLHFLPFGGLLR